jgi:CRISPR-associated protein Cmr1
VSLLKPVTSPAGNPRGQALTFDVEVVTPMFLAGARNRASNDKEQSGKPDDIAKEYLRPSSLKSMLRWWWRAVAPYADPTVLVEREGILFGDTRHGQGIHVSTQRHANWRSGIGSMPPSQSLGYLLGQGLFHFKSGVVRPAVYPASTASFTIRGSIDADLQRALDFMGLLGGLGSRSRRGWGSIAYGTAPHDPQVLQQRLKGLLASTPSAQRAWSHLTPNTRFVVLDQPFESWDSALDALGKPMMAMRQQLGGQKAPYGPDHDLVADLLHQQVMPRQAPRRAAFGLPHPYYFKSSNKSLVFQWNGSDRRASPLLLHVAKLATGRFAAVALVMSGPFLPAGSAITTDKNPRVALPPPSLNLLGEYLDRLSGKA